MSFRDIIQADAQAILQGDGFAESITYTPHGSVPKTIQAVVMRQPLRITKEGGKEWPTGVVDLLVSTDLTLGIAEPMPGVDTAIVSFDAPGSAQVTVRISAILESNDPGMWMLTAKR